MPDLSPDLLRRVEQLAHLRLSEDQRERLHKQLAAILEHFARLDEVDVDRVDPLAHPGEILNRLGRDIAIDGLGVESIMDMAPSHLQGRLVVPRVLDDASSA